MPKAGQIFEEGTCCAALIFFLVAARKVWQVVGSEPSNDGKDYYTPNPRVVTQFCLSQNWSHQGIQRAMGQRSVCRCAWSALFVSFQSSTCNCVCVLTNYPSWSSISISMRQTSHYSFEASLSTISCPWCLRSCLSGTFEILFVCYFFFCLGVDAFLHHFTGGSQAESLVTAYGKRELSWITTWLGIDFIQTPSPPGFVINCFHKQATGKEFVPSVVLRFLWLTVFHAILDTCKRHAMNRVVWQFFILLSKSNFSHFGRLLRTDCWFVDLSLNGIWNLAYKDPFLVIKSFLLLDCCTVRWALLKSCAHWISSTGFLRISARRWIFSASPCPIW